MEMKLHEYLAAGKILIADGATGTMLMAAGLPVGMSPELWNVEQPNKILALHRAYLDAGSQVIMTNTFGGSSIKLQKSGLSGRAREFNLAAAGLAHQASAGKAFIAGDIGPTGELMKPMGTLTVEGARASFLEQAAALAEGGVDAIWVETMSDLSEAKAAIEGAREATDLPVFCSLSFGRRARTMMGVTPKQAALELWPVGLTAIGANCGEGLEMISFVLSQMREALPEAVLIAKPNAGMPKLNRGETVYDVDPVEFGSRMIEFIDLGARVVGSCCGSSPEYIAELSKRILRN
jgi:5-methyltetrahydrofolate--homocysteine methyltransferase